MGKWRLPEKGLDLPKVTYWVSWPRTGVPKLLARVLTARKEDWKWEQSIKGQSFYSWIISPTLNRMRKRKIRVRNQPKVTQLAGIHLVWNPGSRHYSSASRWKDLEIRGDWGGSEELRWKELKEIKGENYRGLGENLSVWAGSSLMKGNQRQSCIFFEFCVISISTALVYSITFT